METSIAVILILAGAALFVLFVLHAGKINGELQSRLMETRTEMTELRALSVADLRGETRAQIYYGSGCCYVGLSVPTKNGPHNIDVKRFPYGDDRAFAIRQAEELCDKINEK